MEVRAREVDAVFSVSVNTKAGGKAGSMLLCWESPLTAPDCRGIPISGFTAKRALIMIVLWEMSGA